MPGRSFTIPRNQARINIPRNQARNKEPRSKNQQKPISETCPKNSTISSSHESPTTPIAKKKKNFTPFRATSQVSVAAPIVDWQSKKKKQKLRIKTLKFVDGDSTFSTHNSCCRKGRKARHSCMAASFDDFVVSRKPHSAKGRVDIDKESDNLLVMKVAEQTNAAKAIVDFDKALSMFVNDSMQLVLIDTASYGYCIM
ncbi:hypothetical protein RDI58_028807 [Solanum bulbocastanum]|uniref:Uncharacterized protein n=1 Tax=Solanum bulbocastanum TaxID=147425 RepID=A0AAN8SSJ6_SOLBU